jgi:hypothetical protein
MGAGFKKYSNKASVAALPPGVIKLTKAVQQWQLSLY